MSETIVRCLRLTCIAALIPEETIAGYDRATAVGTDFIEMDIVSLQLCFESI